MTRIDQIDPMVTDYLAGNDVEIDVFVSQRIGSLTLDKYGMTPLAGMLSLVADHANELGAGGHAEYHARLPMPATGMTNVTVVVALDEQS